MTEYSKSPEHDRQTRIEYWHEDSTKKSVGEFLGSESLGWDHMNQIKHEFLTVANRRKMRMPDKQSPGTVIVPEVFADSLEHFNGEVELHASLWQKESLERPGYPSRVLLLWDVDYYNKAQPNWFYNHSIDGYDKLEPAYQLMRQTLDEYGIDHMAVATGSGYHFITQIPDTSPVLDKLLQLVVVETTVRGKQASPDVPSKRTKPVPPNAEAAHLGATRLQQFLFNQIMRSAREYSPLNVEVSDMGTSGIALDNTAMIYSVQNRSLGVPGTPYFIKPEQRDPNFNQTIIRIPRATNDVELDIGRTLQIRHSYRDSSEYLKQIDCSIPDGSQGVNNLIQDYLQSGLYGLHQTLDGSFGDSPTKYDQTYRRYNDIVSRTSQPDHLRRLISNANDELLKPDNLNYFIYEVFRSWGGSQDKLASAPHVAGLLRAIYEDPKLHWGTRWMKEKDANRYARGWVSIVLGQSFET